MSGAVFVLLSQVVTIIGCSLTMATLYRTGLYRRYRNFFGFFLFRLLSTVASMAVLQSAGIKSPVYFYMFLTETPIGWVFYVMVVLELYKLILEKHPGVYTLGRWGMYIGLAVAVVLSGLALLPKITPAMQQGTRWMYIVLYVDRGVTFALVLFVLIILGMLGFYPIPLSRNLKVHTVLYTILFLSSTVYGLMRIVFGLKYSGSFDAAFMAVSSLCGLMWFFFLKPEGEWVAALPRVDPDHESRLLQQIESLNSTLLKVSRN